MKYSKTALGLLNAQYRSVLRKCFLINAGLFALGAVAATPANAELNDEITTTTGTAKIWNEDSGGGAMYTNTDGTISFVGVNNGGADGITAQIYSVDTTDNSKGVRLDVIGSGDDGAMYYIAGKTKTEHAAIVADPSKLSDYEVTNVASVNGLIEDAVTEDGGVIKSALDEKQAKLTSSNAGNGIEISDTGVISAKAGDTTITVDASGIKVGTIAQSQVSGLTDSLDGKQATIDSTNTLDSAFINTTNYANSALETAVKGTKVDNATSADSAKAVTSDAVDGSSIGLNDSGKLEVVSVAASKVSGLADVATSGEADDVSYVNTTSGLTADNVQAAIDEVVSDIKVAAGGNYIEAGADVKGNLGKLDTAIGKVADGTYNAISASNNVAANLQALDTALGDVKGVVDNHTTSLNSIAQLVDGGTVAATGVYTAGEALTAYDSANTITGVVNKLETNKQENLVIAADSGLKMASDGKTLSVLAGAGMEVTTAGVGIRNLGVTTDMLGSKVVTTEKIGDSAVDTLQLKNLAVTSDKLADNAVTSAKIADGAVLEDKIANGAVSHAKIADGAVDTNNLADGAVETDKIADGNVTFAKLSTDSYDTTGASITAGSDNVLTTGAAVKLGAENANYSGSAVKGADPAPTTIGAAIDATTDALNNVLTATGDEIDSAKVDVQWNDTDSTLNVVLGDGKYTTEHNIAKGDSVTATFSALDAAIGDRSNIGSLNTAINTATASSVAEGLAAAGNAIGDLQYAAPTAVAYGDLTANTNLTTVAAQIAYNIGNAVTNATNGVAATQSVNANIDALNTKVGNVATLDVNGYNATADGANLVAGVSALNGNMEAVLGGIYADDGTYDNTALLDSTNPNGFETGATDLSDALKKYAENNQAATGVSYNADGSVATTYTKATTTNYAGLVANSSLKSAIEQLDGNIGTAIAGVNRSATLATATTLAANTVNANIDALDAAIGDLDYTGGTVSYELAKGSATTGIKTLVATIGTQADNTYKNLDAAGAEATINDNLDALDAAIGDRSNIASKNDAINQGTARNVAAGLKAAGDAIGDMNFGQSHYVSAQNDLSGAVRTLDSNLYRVETDLHDLKRDFNRGMASMAAMSALVPNPRAHGNTSLAIGTGAYSGHTAAAIGGFHYLTDNIMLNAGVAWGNSRDASYRMGVTFSW